MVDSFKVSADGPTNLCRRGGSSGDEISQPCTSSTTGSRWWPLWDEPCNINGAIIMRAAAFPRVAARSSRRRRRRNRTLKHAMVYVCTVSCLCCGWRLKFWIGASSVPQIVIPVLKDHTLLRPICHESYQPSSARFNWTRQRVSSLSVSTDGSIIIASTTAYRSRRCGYGACDDDDDDGFSRGVVRIVGCQLLAW
jgi:hypothetical protein